MGGWAIVPRRPSRHDVGRRPTRTGYVVCLGSDRRSSCRASKVRIPSSRASASPVRDRSSIRTASPPTESRRSALNRERPSRTRPPPTHPHVRVLRGWPGSSRQGSVRSRGLDAGELERSAGTVPDGVSHTEHVEQASSVLVEIGGWGDLRGCGSDADFEDFAGCGDQSTQCPCRGVASALLMGRDDRLACAGPGCQRSLAQRPSPSSSTDQSTGIHAPT